MKRVAAHLAYFIFCLNLIALLTGCAGKFPPEASQGQAGSRKETEQEEGNRKQNEVTPGLAEGAAREESEPLLLVTDHRGDGAAKNVEYAGRTAFLEEYGFDGNDPLLEYVREDGEQQLELYYNKGKGIGCGIWYGFASQTEPRGFLFNGSGNYRYYLDFMRWAGLETDPYDVLSVEGDNGKEWVEDYQESAAYREDGRLAHYSSQGVFNNLMEEKETQALLEIDWSYREDGTLWKRDYWHNDRMFGTWYCSRQSYYDERERLVYEHCYITHGSLDFYYIYEGDEAEPVYCLLIDHNPNMPCAELLEYHGVETEMIYGRIGPALSGEEPNSYVKAIRETAREMGIDYEGCVSHTYAMDYDGDSVEEAFVIIGKETDLEEYGIYEMSGDLWFVDRSLEAPRCIERYGIYDMSQEFIWQDGEGYLFLSYSVGLPWRTQIYAVRDHVPVLPWDTSTYKYLNRQGQVIQIQDAYDGSCTMTNTGEEQDEEKWWMGHTWKPYTYFFDHGQLREVSAREVAKEEVERIAPLPASFYEIDPETIRQFILRDNGELNINMAEESEWGENETMINYSYVTYKLNENGEWEYADSQMGNYLLQFEGGKPYK